MSDETPNTPLKKKLSLADLKVQSFVTTLNDEQSNQVAGGAPLKSIRDDCITQYQTCPQLPDPSANTLCSYFIPCA